jgi:mannose-6-phosphate isomerase
MSPRPDPRLGPWPVVPHRVTRFYRGGALLEAFRSGALEAPGRDMPVLRPDDDTDRPEDWVASGTRARPPVGEPSTDEGLAAVEIEGRPVLVRDLLDADPEALAGPIVRVAGPTTGLLVKLLDAAVRLPVHAHPTRAFARRHLASWFGKTEAWIVLATRPIDGEPGPHVRLGFRRDVGRDELRSLIDGGRTRELLDLLHHRPIAAGDAWLVPAGMPHAIGAGTLILELQEPSDASIVAETAGVPIGPDDAHLGLGWDTTIDALDRRALDDAALDALRGPRASDEPAPAESFDADGLLPPTADPYLRASRWRVRGEARPDEDPAFLVGMVIAGSGIARVDAGLRLELRAGMSFAVPAAGLPGLVLEGDGLTIVACLPPTPADLVRDDPQPPGDASRVS